jgi:hypothetical protein
MAEGGEMRQHIVLLIALTSMGACGTSGNEQPAGDTEADLAGIAEIVQGDPRLAVQQALAPEDYGALANLFAAVPGVEVAEYSGDTLGTIGVLVRGEGVLKSRHTAACLAPRPPCTSRWRYLHFSRESCTMPTPLSRVG